MTCTTIDHIYPATAVGTACYCGKRRWGQDNLNYTGPTAPAKAPRLPRKRAMVRMVIDGLDTLWFVDDVDREAGMFHIEGKGWHEAREVIR